jgi:hypothetical protein
MSLLKTVLFLRTTTVTTNWSAANATLHSAAHAVVLGWLAAIEYCFWPLQMWGYSVENDAVKDFDAVKVLSWSRIQKRH